MTFPETSHPTTRPFGIGIGISHRLGSQLATILVDLSFLQLFSPTYNRGLTTCVCSTHITIEKESLFFYLVQ